VLFGLAQYTLSDLEIPLLDELWLVAATQTTIGFGDVTPQSTLGQFAVLLMCFCGMFVLGLFNFLGQHSLKLSPKEFPLYSHIVYHQTRQKSMLSSVVLIQRWWRFITARIHKKTARGLVTSFFSHMTVHHTDVLVAHASAESKELTEHINRTNQAINRKIAESLRYLHSLHYCKDLVTLTHATDLSRKQYQFELLTDRLLLFCQGRKLHPCQTKQPRHKIRIQLLTPNEAHEVQHSSLKLAKRRNGAFLSVRRRVGKAWSAKSSGSSDLDQSPATPSSVNSR
jgi:hypothetical protein